MDMLYPGMPVQQGPANNYASPLKNSVTPSVNQAQNTMNLEKSAMLPDEEKVEYRRNEDADEKGKKGKKRHNEKEQPCKTCDKRRSENLNSGVSSSQIAELLLKQSTNNLNCHVSNKQVADSENIQPNANGKDVIFKNQVIHYNFCPECGKPYISPGTLSSVIRAASASEKLGAQYQTGYDIMPRGSSINTEA